MNLLWKKTISTTHIFKKDYSIPSRLINPTQFFDFKLYDFLYLGLGGILCFISVVSRGLSTATQRCNVWKYEKIVNKIENLSYQKIKKIVMRWLKLMRARTRNYFIFLSGLIYKETMKNTFSYAEIY